MSEPDLPALIKDQRGWVLYAACTDGNPDDWYPDAPPYNPEQKKVIEKAVTTCFEECPVRLMCLKDACNNRERHGIWGGLTGTTRRGERSPRTAHDYEALSELPNPYE